jgi:hypothetical protein
MKIKILLFANLILVWLAIGMYLDHSREKVVTSPITGKSTSLPAGLSINSKTLPTGNKNEVNSYVRSPLADETKSNSTPEPVIRMNPTPEETPLKINGYIVQDPLARTALSFVGSDSDADAYWANAISDPTLPAEERKDLIEDLNEDGLSDPEHPGAADAPLISARIQLIEELAPYAMDEVNARAFAEAEKDLVGMLNGQAPP